MMERESLSSMGQAKPIPRHRTLLVLISNNIIIMHGSILYVAHHISGLVAAAQSTLRGGGGGSISVARTQNEPLSTLHSIIRELRGGGGGHESEPFSNNNIAKSSLSFEDIFESHPCIDYSDNHEQAQRIKHHYMNEFGKHISLNEVMKDYSPDAVIHEVIDNNPKTYHGRDGVRKAFRDMYRKIPHDTSHFEFEHIAIDHDHAQVVWKAEIPNKDVLIRGMDSFAFDAENRITNQSTMAISSKRQQQQQQPERHATTTTARTAATDDKEVNEVTDCGRSTPLGQHFHNSGMY